MKNIVSEHDNVGKRQNRSFSNGRFAIAFIAGILSLAPLLGNALDNSEPATNAISAPGPDRSAAPPVLVAASDAWCPYTCDPDSDRPGILVEISREIFNDAGIDFEYRLLPWKRALSETEKGTVDAALGVVEGNREGLLLDESGFGIDETVLVLRRESKSHYSKPEDLDPIRVGVTASYTYDNNGDLDQYLLKRRGDNDRVVAIYHDKPIASLLEMLSVGRIDGFLENRHVAIFESRRLGYDGKFRIAPTGLGDTIHIGFPDNQAGRKNQSIMNAGLSKMRDTGRIKTIMSRYGLVNIPVDIQKVTMGADD